VIVCERCAQGWQESAGAKLPISAAALERATCDAQHIGSLDGAVPERAHQDIPPSVARLVWRRDGGRCRVPGCRSTRGLEIHHLVHRADGGNHDAMNLALTCSSCHIAHHRGVLTITGTADHIVVQRPESRPPVPTPGAHVGARANFHTGEPAVSVTGAHVDAHTHEPAVAVPGAHVGATDDGPAEARTLGDRPGKLDAAILRAHTKDALIGLGWKPAIAAAAVAAAAAGLGPETTLEQLIREALRRCPRPAT